MDLNQLFIVIIRVLNQGMTARAIYDVSVKQSFQPKAQGANSQKTMYLFKLFDRLYGSPERKDEWINEPTPGLMRHTERQKILSTFQLTATLTQSVLANGQTSSDLANIAASIMRSDFAMTELQKEGLSIFRVMDVRNPGGLNDRDQNEFYPSFDFTIEHEQVIISEVPAVFTTEFNVARV